MSIPEALHDPAPTMFVCLLASFHFLSGVGKVGSFLAGVNGRNVTELSARNVATAREMSGAAASGQELGDLFESSPIIQISCPGSQTELIVPLVQIPRSAKTPVYPVQAR